LDHLLASPILQVSAGVNAVLDQRDDFNALQVAAVDSRSECQSFIITILPSYRRWPRRDVEGVAFCYVPVD
jgi:hypothetical protein